MKKTLLFLIFTLAFIFNLSAKEKPRLAVLALLPIGVDQMRVDAIRENLTTEIINTGFYDVVERSQINALFSEMNLSLSSEFDDETAAELGQMLGVKEVIIGSVTMLDGDTTINIRIVNVETGLARFADNVFVKEGRSTVQAIKFLVEKMVATLNPDEGNDNEDEGRKEIRLSTAQKFQIGAVTMTSAGGLAIAAGLIVFLVDNLYIWPLVEAASTYPEYLPLHTKDMALFGTGLGLMILGTTVALASLPFWINYKKAISFYIIPGTDPGISVSIGLGRGQPAPDTRFRRHF